MATQQPELHIEDNKNVNEEPIEITVFIKQEVYEDDNNVSRLTIKQEELTIKNENHDPFYVSLDEVNQYTFSSAPESAGLNNHVGEELFSCSSCDYKTTKKRYLVDHRKMHTEATSFTCTFCNYKCKKKSNLTRHMRNHTGEKPFNCDICSNKFTDKSSFSFHLKIHTGEKPFTCTTCDYKCIRKADLVRHLRTHTGEKPYECHLCNYKCTAKGRLNRHVKGHARKSLFSCELCDYKSVREGNLSSHIVKTHTEQNTKSEKFLKKNESVCYLKDHCAGAKDESYWCEEDSDVDGDLFEFNLQKGSEQVQDVKDELVVKEESLWEV